MGAPRRCHPQSTGGTKRCRRGNALITVRANKAHHFPVRDHGEGQIAFFTMFSELHFAKISPIFTLRHRSATGAGASEDQIGGASVCRQAVEPLVMRSREHIDDFPTGGTRLFIGEGRFRIIHTSVLPNDVAAVGAFDGHILLIGTHDQQYAELGRTVN